MPSGACHLKLVDFGCAMLLQEMLHLLGQPLSLSKLPSHRMGHAWVESDAGATPPVHCW